MSPTFKGFRRPDGRVGVRNHLLLVPTSSLVNRVCDLVERARPDVVSVTHQDGSSKGDEELMIRVLAGFAANPNVASVLLMGLGDAGDPLDRIANEAERLGARVCTLTVLQAGGLAKAAERAVSILDEESGRYGGAEREPVSVSELLLGTECGGSDAYSGLTANPALGVCCDRLIADGGSAILAEMTELIGAEHIVAQHAQSAEVRERLLAVVQDWERFLTGFGEDIRGAQPTPGNIEGGLTTIEEKSLGCAYKGGTSPIVDMVGYGARSTKRGLLCMDTPGHDVEQLTGMVAGGAQLVVFTTGRGTPAASPIAPTIKVSTNSQLAERFAMHIDLDAGTIANGIETVEAVGARLYEMVLQVASGRLTKAEAFGQRDFALPRTAASV